MAFIIGGWRQRYWFTLHPQTRPRTTRRPGSAAALEDFDQLLSRFWPARFQTPGSRARSPGLA